jgi:glycosyltransferase involved in cell wall biosynthesis
LKNARVTIFTKKKTDQLKYEIDPVHGFEIIRIPCESPPPFKQSAEFVLKLKECIQEKNYAREIDYDIWHCRSPFDGYLLAQEAERRGQPMIYEVNGLPSIEWPYHYPKILKKKRKAMRRLAAMELLTALTATHVVVPSRVTKEYLVSRQVPREKITIIPNGVNTRKFEPNRLPPALRARLLDLPRGWEELLLIGYIGAFQPWQGLHTLVESLTELRSLNGKDSFGFILMGKSKSSWRHALRKIAKKNDVRELIHFCSPRSLSLMPQVVNCFDIAVAPLADTPRNTVQGCNPIKLYEYAACGLPVVASDLPVTREILPDNTCYYVPPDSPVDLGEALKFLIQNPEEREELGKRARMHFLIKNNDWRNRVMLLQRLYETLLDQ